MEKINLKLISDYSELEWLKNSLTPWPEIGHLQLSSIIPSGHQSYVAVRCSNSDPKIGPVGTLDYEKLFKYLQKFTSSPEVCFSALWNGFGWDVESELPQFFENLNFQNYKLFELPNRAYYVFSGPLLENLKMGHKLGEIFFFEPSNLIWPEDRSWFLAKEIDFDVCLIGGSNQLINEIVDSGLFICEKFNPEQTTNSMYICG